ncbi:hypothetical protein ACEPPZ_19535 [Paracoccus yeei]|uniref:hypothetical protein n=1 Tax=Paracoccus yeei TaxID=147645 RepID=UPI0037D23A1F
MISRYDLKAILAAVVALVAFLLVSNFAEQRPALVAILAIGPVLLLGIGAIYEKVARSPVNIPLQGPAAQLFPIPAASILWGWAVYDLFASPNRGDLLMALVTLMLAFSSTLVAVDAAFPTSEGDAQEKKINDSKQRSGMIVRLVVCHIIAAGLIGYGLNAVF